MSETSPAGQLAAQVDIQRYPLLARSTTTLDGLFQVDLERLDITALGNAILLDPGLTIKLLAAANTIPHKHLGTPLGAVQHAIMMLGLERVLTLYRDQPHLGEQLEEEPQRRLLDLYSRAHHAAVQATGWAQRRSDMNPGEVYVTAMLQRLGWMVLWVERPDDAARARAALLENTAGKQPLPEAEVLEPLLGFTPEQLTTALVERWGLPPFLAETLDPGKQHNPRVLSIRTADRLAFELDNNWYRQPISGLLWKVAQVLHLPYHRTANVVHRDAVVAARAWRAYDVVPAAAALLDTGEPEAAAPPEAIDPLTRDTSLASEAYALSAEGVAPSPLRRQRMDEQVSSHMEVVAPTTPPPAPNVERRSETAASAEGMEVRPQAPPQAEPVFDTEAKERTRTAPPGIAQANVDSLISAIDGSLSLPDAMHQVLHGLHHYVGLRRVVFAMLTADRERLRARATLGSHGVESLAGAQVEMSQPHLFSKLMERPQAIWCRPDNSAELRPFLPSGLAEQLDSDNFMAMSVHVNGRPVGIFYGDGGGDPCALESSHYDLFQRLCGHAAKAIGDLSKKKQ